MEPEVAKGAVPVPCSVPTRVSKAGGVQQGPTEGFLAASMELLPRGCPMVSCWCGLSPGLALPAGNGSAVGVTL